ncbi:ComEA family DNA-binding protein [Cellulosimicrobium sp. PMB13]|uniref:helix-hairpin-helix domain-containing protein n=1 Tax=Cellulosimicrobium sp. PMB13 TaxID=3120158 RepID=UPI003F4C4309
MSESPSALGDGAEGDDDPWPDGTAAEADDGAAAEAIGLRARRRTATTVAHAYAAAHGHPTTHSGFAALDPPDTSDEGVGPGTGRVRASIAVRVAVAASLLVLVLGGVTAALTLRPEPVAALAAVDDAPGTDVGGPSGEEARAAADTVGGPHDDAATDDAAGGESPDAGAGADLSPEGAAAVVVHVVGQVVTPGLVSVPAGARVADALTAAGGAGPDADLTALNLARTVVDGEQIVVPRPGEVVASGTTTAGPTGAGTTGAGSTAGTAAGPVDLNTADAAALDGLPGIGPVLAERIVAWRDANGRFTSVDELGEVSGIGPATLTDLRDLVRV